MANSKKRYPRGTAERTTPADGAILHLDRWIRENRKNLKPPVSNRQLLTASKDAIVFVSGGPNTRNDYHVNPTEELFYQLKGDIAVRVRPLDGSEPQDVVIREGELFLLPRWVPHRPQRPAGTLGLIIEFPRPKGEKDALRWYCPKCDELVHEASWRLKKIDEDLKVIMEGFWGGPAKRRTCKACGHVIERAGAFKMPSASTAKRSSSKVAKSASVKGSKHASKRAARKATKRSITRRSGAAR